MELCVLSGVESVNLALLHFSLVSIAKKHCLLYQNLAFEQCVCSLPERPYSSSCAKFLQTILD